MFTTVSSDRDNATDVQGEEQKASRYGQVVCDLAAVLAGNNSREAARSRCGCPQQMAAGGCGRVKGQAGQGATIFEARWWEGWHWATVESRVELAVLVH